MKLIYSCRYTQYSAAHRACFENTAWISGSRGQQLTLEGCQRILRRTLPEADVISREAWLR
jgi:hypothetical protein